jgi:hypothetical protein
VLLKKLPLSILFLFFLATMACGLLGAPAIESEPMTESDVTVVPVELPVEPNTEQPNIELPAATEPQPTATRELIDYRIDETPAAQLPVMEVVNDTCATLVLDTIAEIESGCYGMGGNQACVVGAPLTAHASQDNAAQEIGPGSHLALDSFWRLHTRPGNLDQNEWGGLRMNLQPGTADQPLTFLISGDVVFASAKPGEPLAQAQAYSVATSANQPQCPGAPNSLIVQSPPNTVSLLTIDQVELVLENAVLVLKAEPDQALRVYTLLGEVTLAAQGEEQRLEIGETSAVKLGGEQGLEADSVPSAAEAFDPDIVEHIPFYLISENIDIPAEVRWTSTGVELEPGQTFVVIAAGLVKTIDYMPWSAPSGHPESDCIAAGRDDWDCRCRTLPEWGTCTMDEVASMTLLGRVGEDDPFIVRSGGFFTVRVAGELQLGPNDNTFDDNVAAYHAIVVVFDWLPGETPNPTL